MQSRALSDDMWVTQRDKYASGSYSLLRCVERLYPLSKLHEDPPSHVKPNVFAMSPA
jgi:hypothetical protein